MEQICSPRGNQDYHAAAAAAVLMHTTLLYVHQPIPVSQKQIHIFYVLFKPAGKKNLASSMP